MINVENTPNEITVESNVNVTEKLTYENPMFYKLLMDPNNPWVLIDQIRYYKERGVPIKRLAFQNQKTGHYYAIFNAGSKAEADEWNRTFNRENKQADRAMQKILEHETNSCEVMMESGEEAISDEGNPEEIAAYHEMYKELNKCYEALEADKKKLVDTVKDGMTQREAAEELGLPRGTYRDHKDAVVLELAEKMKDWA